MGFIFGEFIEKFGVSTTAQIRLDLKKLSPRIIIYSWGYFVLKMGLTLLGCFSSKRRFENQKSTKTKKQALCFSLLFDLFCKQRSPIIELFRARSRDAYSFYKRITN